MARPEELPGESRTHPLRSTWASIVAAVLTLGLLAAIALLSSVRNTRNPYDQNVYHLPTILKFADELPRPDLSNYASTTTPGYHLAMAVVARWVSDDVGVLRCVGAGFGLLLVALLAFLTTRQRGHGDGLLLALPLACSLYVISSTGWLLPENAAWLLVLACVGVCLFARPSAISLFGWSVLALVLVSIRQSHAWVALPMFVWLLNAWWPRWTRVMLMAALVMLPAIVLLGFFVWLWHGVVPPMFQPGSTLPGPPLMIRSGGFAPGAAMFTLALLGLLGTPLIARFWPTTIDSRRRAARALLIGLGCGLIIALASPSSYKVHERRTALFNVAHRLTDFVQAKTGIALEAHDRSFPMMLLTIAGGAVVALSLNALRPRDRWILAAALVGFTAAQMTTVLLWQRYYEPMLLIWLALAASRSTVTDEGSTQRRLIIAGSILLIAMQLTVAWTGLMSVTSPAP